MPKSEKEKLRHGYPRMEWHGGYVRVIRPSVLMLERGYVFDIDGASCFAFGGARSHDISDGIIDPRDYQSETEMCEVWEQRQHQMVRTYGVSWWPQEMPTPKEMQDGKQILQEYMAKHGSVDFVFTHEAPASDKRYLGYDTDEFSRYLESLKQMMVYGKWFYGHLHGNRKVFENHYLLYEHIYQIH